MKYLSTFLFIIVAFFTVTTSGYCQSPKAKSHVQLLMFSGHTAEHTVHLKWSTVAESDNMGFEVERSIDGINFSTRTFVEGHGTTRQLRRYQFQERAVAANCFYRLKQIAGDGTFSYSPVIRLDQGNLSMETVQTTSSLTITRSAGEGRNR